MGKNGGFFNNSIFLGQSQFGFASLYNSNLLCSYLGIGTSRPYVFDGNSLVDVYFSLMGLKGKLCGDWGTKSLSPKNSMSFFSPNNCGLFMAFDGGLQGLEKSTLYQ